MFNVENGTIDYSRPTTPGYTGKFYFSYDKFIDAEVSGHNFFVHDDARIGPTLLNEAEEYKMKLHDKFVLGG